MILLIFNNSTSISPIYTFTLPENIIVYMPNKVQSREKYFKWIIYNRKMLTLAGNKHLSVNLFSRRLHFFQLLTENVRA